MRPTGGKPLSCDGFSFFHAHTYNAILAQKCPESAEEGIQCVCHYHDHFTNVRAEMKGVGVVLHKCVEMDKRN